MKSDLAELTGFLAVARARGFCAAARATGTSVRLERSGRRLERSLACGSSVDPRAASYGGSASRGRFCTTPDGVSCLRLYECSSISSGLSAQPVAPRTPKRKRSGAI
jgi:hypothetical protein